jgi:uncharacterized protein (DUF342 family)
MKDNSSMENDSLDLGLGGVWVKDGKVFVKDPSADVSILAITPCEGVELVINGEAATGRTKVCEKDEIVLNPLAVEEPGSYKITVAPDCLSASLEVKMSTVTGYSVLDAGPEISLNLRAEARVEKKCPFTLAEILHGLSGKNITFGIKHSEINAVLAGKEDSRLLIAEGEAPGETVNDRVELKFNVGQEEQRINDTGKRLTLETLLKFFQLNRERCWRKNLLGFRANPAGR